MDHLVLRTSSQQHGVQWHHHSAVNTAIITSVWTGFHQENTTELLCHHPLRLEDHPLHLPLHESPLYLLVLPSCRAAFSMVIAEAEAEAIELLRVEKTSQDHQVHH